MANEWALHQTQDYAAWDALVEASPQGTIFSDSRFLRSLQCRFRLWQVLAGKKVVAQLAAIEDDSGENLRQFPFTPYQGPLFLHEAHTLPRQRVLDEFRIGEFLVEALCQQYRNLDMSLSWLLQDVRPFLWHNYHAPKDGQFRLDVRYTALLSLRDVEQEEIKMRTRACRRQELKKAAAYETRFDADVAQFIQIYTSTFARQEIVLNQQTLELVERISTAAIAAGYGSLSSCSTKDGVAAMDLFLYDSKRAYYLFAANDPNQRNSGATTRLMFENIFAAKARGMPELDFVGVNSPNRGDFKLSFSPELKLYFDAHLRREDNG